jgi:CPA1 family monovalent cation:H+ antiporter
MSGIHVLEAIVGLIAIVVAVTAAARRFNLLLPIMLVVVGLALSFVPGFPIPRLDPELVIVAILPPLIYVAAIEISVPAFRYNLRAILQLAVGHVLFIAFLIGFVVHMLLPDVPLAACLALGAVVAPPDAIAATAVARRIGLPRRMVVILEGESLLNDATALVLFRVAVAVAVGTALGPLEVARNVVVAAGGGVLVGAAGAILFKFLHKKTTDPLIDNALSLITPFVVAVAAEFVGASGVVAVVVTGLYLGHRFPTLMSAASRLQTFGFWQILKYLLEGMVFLVVGLQLREIVRQLHEPLWQVVLITLVVVLTVVVGRFVWVYPSAYLARLVPQVRRREPPLPRSIPVILGWAGMRGVITLATALALPATLAGGADYPRTLFVWLAFAVIVATLVLQGLTLPVVARWANPPRDDQTRDFLAEAQVQNDASRAARARLDEQADGAPPDVVERLRRLTETRSNAVWERLGGGGETPSVAYMRLRREMLDAEREVFRVARNEGRIPEEILVRAQRQLDLEESLLERSED